MRLGEAGGRGAYRCDDATAVLLRVEHIRAPIVGLGRRGYVVERLRAVLRAIASNAPLPSVPVCCEPDTTQAVLLDGAHRLAVSIAFGVRGGPVPLGFTGGGRGALSVHGGAAVGRLVSSFANHVEEVLTRS